MELKIDLQGLIEKAWALHDGLSDEINNSKGFFCTFCSENGCDCDNAETPCLEGQKLISIRDSLKEVGNVLMLLQVHQLFFLDFFFLCACWEVQQNSP